jgi:hypothetical protein
MIFKQLIIKMNILSTANEALQDVLQSDHIALTMEEAKVLEDALTLIENKMKATINS